MKIRPAYKEELDALHCIVRYAARRMDEQGIPQWDKIYPDRETLSKDIEKQEMHVIESEGRIEGLIVLNEEQPQEYAEIAWRYSGPAFVVHRLTIDPSHQHRGLGTRLMDFAERTAAFKGYCCIRLDAFIRNPAAIALHEKRGYRKAGAVRFRKGDFYCFEKSIKGSIMK